jgi:hypothetical protein
MDVTKDIKIVLDRCSVFSFVLSSPDFIQSHYADWLKQVDCAVHILVFYPHFLQMKLV